MVSAAHLPVDGQLCTLPLSQRLAPLRHVPQDASVPPAGAGSKQVSASDAHDGTDGTYTPETHTSRAPPLEQRRSFSVHGPASKTGAASDGRSAVVASVVASLVAPSRAGPSSASGASITDGLRQRWSAPQV